MEYTISIEELIKRPIISDDKVYEFLNKMTNEEIRQFEKEIELNLLEEGVKIIYPDYNANFISKIINILYNLFKLK